MRNPVSHWHPQAWHSLRASASLRICHCVLLLAGALAALHVLGTNVGLLLCLGKLSSQRLRLTRLLLFAVSKWEFSFIES